MSLQKFEIVDMASPYIVFTGCLMPLFTCPARSSCESPSQISRSGARDALLEVEGRPVLLLAPRLTTKGTEHLVGLHAVHRIHNGGNSHQKTGASRA